MTTGEMEKLKELAAEIVRLKEARSHMLDMFNLHAIAHLIYGEVEIVELDKQINDSVNELLEKVIACPARGDTGQETVNELRHVMESMALVIKTMGELLERNKDAKKSKQ